VLLDAPRAPLRPGQAARVEIPPQLSAGAAARKAAR
jgi:hypothetical protein